MQNFQRCHHRQVHRCFHATLSVALAETNNEWVGLGGDCLQLMATVRGHLKQKCWKFNSVWRLSRNKWTYDKAAIVKKVSGSGLQLKGDIWPLVKVCSKYRMKALWLGTFLFLVFLHSGGVFCTKALSNLNRFFCLWIFRENGCLLRQHKFYRWADLDIWT